jgi:Ni,Fe-hydrogenase maturation factor
MALSRYDITIMVDAVDTEEFYGSLVHISSSLDPVESSVAMNL